MRHYLATSYLCQMLSIVFFFSFTGLVFPGEYINVKDDAVQESFHLNHSVTRKSVLKIEQGTSALSEEGTATLGTIYLKNNTRDGFKLSVESEHRGYLMPSGESVDKLDGEEALAYTLQVQKTGGYLGTGLSSAWIHDPSSFEVGDGAVTIIAPSVDRVSTPTDVVLSLSVVVEDTAGHLNMAGTYSDVLTLIYQDL
jgi:hypothetical protein